MNKSHKHTLREKEGEAAKRERERETTMELYIIEGDSSSWDSTRSIQQGELAAHRKGQDGVGATGVLLYLDGRMHSQTFQQLGDIFLQHKEAPTQPQSHEHSHSNRDRPNY